MDHVFEVAVGAGGDLGDEVVKGAEDGNVRHDGDGQTARLDEVCVGLSDQVGFALCADGGDDGVVFGEELFKYVGCLMKLAFVFFFFFLSSLFFFCFVWERFHFIYLVE